MVYWVEISTQYKFAGYAARLDVLLSPVPLHAHWGLREGHTMSSICVIHVLLVAALIKESLWQCRPSATE